MKKIAAIILVVFFIAAPYANVQAATFKTYKAIVTTTRLNIRSTASTKGKLVGYYYKNNIVDIIGQTGSWLKTSKGYISAGYTKKYTAPSTASSSASSTATPAFKAYKAVVTTSRLNIRSTASTKGKIVGYYYINNIIDITGQTGSWLKTSKGYITASYTKKYTAPAPSRGTEQPGAAIIKSNHEVNGPVYYNSNRKEITAFPITQMISPSTGNVNEELIPDYTVEKNGTSVQITVNNSSIKNEFSNSFDSLKKSIDIKNLDGAKVLISENFAENTDVNVYTVRKKASTTNNIQTLTTYIVVSLSLPASNQTPESAAPSKQMVVIDAGHGGKDPGACANGLAEKDLNLDIALKLKQDLEMQGYDTYITRDTDKYVDLMDRADAPNIFKADLFVSIHNNANNSTSYNGTTVLYNSKAVSSANSLPSIVQNEIVQALGTSVLRLEDRPGLVVLNSTWVPSVLAEVAVLTNQNDAAIISQESNRQAVADAITKAINMYFGH